MTDEELILQLEKRMQQMRPEIEAVSRKMRNITQLAALKGHRVDWENFIIVDNK